MLKDGDLFIQRLEHKKRILELSEIYLRSLPIEVFPLEYVYYDVFNVRNLYHTKHFISMMRLYNEN